jgi:hypothetical protein
VSDLQVGSWCSPGRLLDAGWGLERAGVRERGRVRSWQRLPRAPPSFVSKRIRQREYERGREKGGRLWCDLVDLARKEEERK